MLTRVMSGGAGLRSKCGGIARILGLATGTRNSSGALGGADVVTRKRAI